MQGDASNKKNPFASGEALEHYEVKAMQKRATNELITGKLTQDDFRDEKLREFA